MRNEWVHSCQGLASGSGPQCLSNKAYSVNAIKGDTQIPSDISKGHEHISWCYFTRLLSLSQNVPEVCEIFQNSLHLELGDWKSPECQGHLPHSLIGKWGRRGWRWGQGKLRVGRLPHQWGERQELCPPWPEQRHFWRWRTSLMESLYLVAHISILMIRPRGKYTAGCQTVETKRWVVHLGRLKCTWCLDDYTSLTFLGAKGIGKRCPVVKHRRTGRF